MRFTEDQTVAMVQLVKKYLRPENALSIEEMQAEADEKDATVEEQQQQETMEAPDISTLAQ